MKPKYNRFTRRLPAAMIVAASLQTVHAAVLADDSQGNFSITAAQTSADSILANGGSDPNNTVFVGSGVNLTGDAMSGAVLTINTAGNYAVSNNGNISGTNHDGINSTLVISVTNGGTIAGGTTTGKQGIETLGGSTITNNAGATISGTDDAIRFTSDGGIVTNAGSITGITGSDSDGISGEFSGLTVMNSNIISGNHTGINAGSSLDLTNNVGGNITGNNAAGVFAGASAIINNYDRISSSQDDGVLVGSNSTIHNRTTYTGFDTYSSASITGGAGEENSGAGVSGGDSLTLTNDYHSTITGNGESGHGVYAGFNLDLTNDGSIRGNNADGISTGNSANITNSLTGVISGAQNGISIYDNGTVEGDSGASTIINHGDIEGNNDTGIFADAYSQTVTNDGHISGDGNAIDLGGGSDTVNLNLNSEIDGDITLSGGRISDTDIINFGEGKTSPEDTSNVVYGNIYGVEIINKDGEGAAFVGDPGDGYDVYANDINVNQGALYINGDVHRNSGEDDNAQINVYGGEIGGEGTWNADINVQGSAMWALTLAKIADPFVVAGVLSPGGTPINVADDVNDAIGTLVVNGNVTLNSNAIYRGEVNPISGDEDFLQLTGVNHTFTAGGATLEISPTNVNSPIHDGSGVIIETDALLGGETDVNAGFGAIALYHSTNTPDTGLFQAQSNPSAPIITDFTKLTKSNDGTDVVATLTHDYGNYGTTPNEVAAGAMLDSLVEGATGDLADLLAALDYSDAATTRATLAALDPGSYFATAAALANSNYGLHRTVETHNAAVRSDSGAVMPAPAPAPSAKGGVAPAPVATGCAGTSNVWGSFSYDWLDVNGSSGQSGDVASFTAGIDFLVAQNFRLGLVAQGAYSDWNGGNGNDSSIDTYRIAAYANWGAATGWFVDALIGYNSSSVDQSRDILMGNLLANQSGSYDADGWQGLLTVGNTIATTSAGNFAPFIGVEMQSLSADSFEASGPLPVEVGSIDIDSIRGLVGVKWDMQVAENFKTYASVAYAYEFEDNAPDTKVRFGGGSYKAYGAEPGDAILVSAGLRWNVVTCTTIDLGYRGEFSTNDGVDSNGVNLGVNYSF